ncbi:MAG: hypothetical protein AB8G26_10085, partial [Ilumatobacter sp.]
AGTTTRIQITGRGNLTTNTTGIIANIAAINPTSHGFITAWNCTTTRPATSSINTRAGVTTPNELIVELSAHGELCVFTAVDTHLIVDVAGTIH